MSFSNIKNISIGIVLLSSAFSTIQAGAITLFTDRSDWEAAVGAGNFVTEDFSGNGGNRQLQNNTIEDVGLFNVFYTTQGSVNERQNDIRNGNSPNGLIQGDFLRLAWDTNNNNGPNSNNLPGDLTTLLQLQFDSSINAFGANFTGVRSNRGLSLTLDGSPVNLYDELGGNGTNERGFLGFILDTSVTSIDFTSTGADTFNMDEVSFGSAPVPLPATILLFGTAVFGLLGLRRKQK